MTMHNERKQFKKKERKVSKAGEKIEKIPYIPHQYSPTLLSVTLGENPGGRKKEKRFSPPEEVLMACPGRKKVEGEQLPQYCSKGKSGAKVAC